MPLVKPSLSSLACLLLAVLTASCGAGGKAGSEAPRPAPAAARAQLPRIELKADGDMDSDDYPNQSPDEENIVFGHPAGAADARAIAALVRRYYADAVRHDGAAACRLLYATRAETVVSSFAGALSPTGKPSTSASHATCATVLSALFRELHARFSAEAAALRVSRVRVELNTASIQMRFGRARTAHYIEGHRERGVWKLGMVSDVEQQVGVE